MLAIPWIVIPRDYVLPSKEPRSGNVGYASFNPLPMFVGLRTRDLDFNGRYLCSVCYFDPSIARELNGIH